MDIDTEWENFISTEYAESDSDEEPKTPNNLPCYGGPIQEVGSSTNLNHNDRPAEDYCSADLIEEIPLCDIPKSTAIYISTKTKIAYLCQPVDLAEVFWKVPVIPYEEPSNGVIKKQMKFNSVTIEQLEFIESQLKIEKRYYEEHIITHIDNPYGRIKFKDTRKISIGISKKDIMRYRCKKKSAFYNCFVLILRLKIDTEFKEFHVKVFNTGKLEIPGIQSDSAFDEILKLILEMLQPHIENNLYYKDETNETVLINSNFNCGFYINREILYDILKSKYKIQAIYDPCSYPGIQCKFHYNPDTEIQMGCQISEENKKIYKNTKEISFMVFRTGSVLIVGRCDIDILLIIYEYLKDILIKEYKYICQKKNQYAYSGDKIVMKEKDKAKKIRKKSIIVEISNTL
jgi:hypothetical protein